MQRPVTTPLAASLPHVLPTAPHCIDALSTPAYCLPRTTISAHSVGTVPASSPNCPSQGASAALQTLHRCMIDAPAAPDDGTLHSSDTPPLCTSLPLPLAADPPFCHPPSSRPLDTALAEAVIHPRITSAAQQCAVQVLHARRRSLHNNTANPRRLARTRHR